MPQWPGWIFLFLAALQVGFGVIEYRQGRERGPVALVPTLPHAFGASVLATLGCAALGHPARAGLTLRRRCSRSARVSPRAVGRCTDCRVRFTARQAPKCGASLRMAGPLRRPPIARSRNVMLVLDQIAPQR